LEPSPLSHLFSFSNCLFIDLPPISLVFDLVSWADMQAGLHWLSRQLFVMECIFLWMCASPLFQDILSYLGIQPVIEHSSNQGRPDTREGLHCFWCPNKTWILLIGIFDALKVIKNEIELKKLRSSKVKGSRTQKNKLVNITKVNSQTPKKFVECCYQSSRRFVELQVTLL
jgi:hypothetical protein